MLTHILIWYEHRLNGIVEARVRSFYDGIAVKEESALLSETDLVAAAQPRVWDEHDVEVAAVAWLADSNRRLPFPMDPKIRNPTDDVLELVSYIHAVADEWGAPAKVSTVEARVAHFVGDAYIDELLPTALDADLLAAKGGAWDEADLSAVALPQADILKQEKIDRANARRLALQADGLDDIAVLP